jgi:hypothetical protein
MDMELVFLNVPNTLQLKKPQQLVMNVCSVRITVTNALEITEKRMLNVNTVISIIFFQKILNVLRSADQTIWRIQIKGNVLTLIKDAKNIRCRLTDNVLMSVHVLPVIIIEMKLIARL